MDPQAPEIMLQFCKAMADESRLRIVGLLSAAEHSEEVRRAREFLSQSPAPHWAEFLAAWDSSAGTGS